MKRYDIIGLKHVSENEQGNWVRYEDHKAHRKISDKIWVDFVKSKRDSHNKVLINLLKTNDALDHYKNRASAAGIVLCVQWLVFIALVSKAWFG